MLCETHKRYLAVMQPRVDCIDCWKMWSIALQLKLAGVNLKIQNLMIQELANEDDNSGE